MGEFPYSANEGPVNLMLQILEDPSPSPSQHNFSLEFCSFVDACPQKEPDARPTAEQVENIPDSFNGVEDYFGSFVYPLLEETRGQLSASLNNISKAPYAEVVSSVQVPPQNGKQIYDVKVDYWRNLHGGRGNVPYKICPADILLFTYFIPDTDSDLQWLRIKWTSLAKVQGDNHSTDQTAICFLANSSSDFQREMSSAKPLFVACMMNLRTNERILNSLQMDANVTITNQVLDWSTQVPDSLTPFNFYDSSSILYDYTLFNCSTAFVSEQEIPCLSNFHYKAYAIASYVDIDDHVDLFMSCIKIQDIPSVPYDYLY